MVLLSSRLLARVADRNRSATLAREALQGGGAFFGVRCRILFGAVNKYGCYCLRFT